MHLGIGQEAVAAGALSVLDPDDAVVATYREHGHALARGIPARAILAEMYGRLEGCCRGRGGSMHLFDAARRFYGGNAIVGPQVFSNGNGSGFFRSKLSPPKTCSK